MRLGVGRSRLYTLRTLWLAAGRRLPLAPSGGDHTEPWPQEAQALLRITLTTGEPANFSFLADELSRRFGFKRSASNVRSHVLNHMPELLQEPLKRGPKPRRRWQRKGYGDLLSSTTAHRTNGGLEKSSKSSPLPSTTPLVSSSELVSSKPKPPSPTLPMSGKFSSPTVFPTSSTPTA